MTDTNGRARYTRRAALRRAAATVAGALAGSAAYRALGGAAVPIEAAGAPVAGSVGRVALVQTMDRIRGLRAAIDLLQPGGIAGQTVLLKPNFNTAGPAPAATDPALLDALVQELRNAHAAQITIGDRSGMAVTRAVLQSKGVFALAQRYGLGVVAFDEMGRAGWHYVPAAGTHWQSGFAFARPVLEAGAVVSTCLLKTHRFGGYFSLSLKNSVGMVARYVPGDPHDYMAELHASPDQRLMIAEVNRVYAPALVVLDGVQAFLTGGPDIGATAATGVVLAGVDRVAIDAVAIALLRMQGTTAAVADGPIWDLEQIRRASELGLGARSAAQVQLVTGDAASRRLADRLHRLL